ncbi:MAG: class I SAM-dependent methyltransferase [Promethearchaeota archaeon]|jgi:hypothetical protein
MTRPNTIDGLSINQKALNSLFDDAIDELEITFDIYFEIERYKPRCVHVLNRLLTSGTREGKILVLGSNEKPFTMFFKKMGFQVEGHSFNPTLKDAKENERETTSSMALMIGNLPQEYEAIICDDILQFFECPAETLAMLKDHLKPGGVLTVTTPNAVRGTSRLRFLAGRNIYPWPSGDGNEPVEGNDQRSLFYREYTLPELDMLVKDIGLGLIKSEFIIGKTVKANMWPPMPVKEYVMQIIFLAFQKIAAPLRNYIFVAARKPLSF